MCCLRLSSRQPKTSTRKKKEKVGARVCVCECFGEPHIASKRETPTPAGNKCFCCSTNPQPTSLFPCYSNGLRRRHMGRFPDFHIERNTKGGRGGLSPGCWPSPPRTNVCGSPLSRLTFLSSSSCAPSIGGCTSAWA